jgi:hypothetical protein
MSKDNSDEKISEALNINFDPDAETKDIVLQQPIEITTDAPKGDEDVDYRLVRNNLKELINIGTGAIEGILAVASEGESPRAYEVAAQMIKVVSEANKDLVDLHKRMGDIKKDKINTNVKNTTNNSIYVGSTKELLDMINDSRSTTKFINHE